MIIISYIKGKEDFIVASLVEELINVLTEEEKYTEHSLQMGRRNVR